MSEHVNQEIEEKMKELMDEKLAECTERQREVFARVYPHGVQANTVLDALELLHRTIKKNRSTPHDH